MTFRTFMTDDSAVSDSSKLLLYGEAGVGKTTQALYYQRRFGRGLVLSLESGLRSLMHAKVEYLPITSWDGKHDPATGVFSFVGVCKMIRSPEFEKEGFKWVMLDSLTELSDLCMAHMEEKHKSSKSPFDKWTDYATQMIGACKFIRDLPVHVIISALVRERTDENGATQYSPLVKGNAVGNQLAGLFDYVFVLIRATSGDRANPKVDRYIVTDEMRGYIAKARDPERRLKTLERSADVTELIQKVNMSRSEYEDFVRALKTAESVANAEKGQKNG